MLDQHVLFEVRDVDWCKFIHLASCIVFGHSNGEHTVVLLVQKRVRSFTVCFVLPLVNIFNDQHVVLDLQGASVKFLAAYISDADIDVVAACRMRDSSDQFRLAVEENELNSSLNIVECYSAHGATVAHVLLRQVNRS